MPRMRSVAFADLPRIPSRHSNPRGDSNPRKSDKTWLNLIGVDPRGNRDTSVVVSCKLRCGDNRKVSTSRLIVGGFSVSVT